MLSSEAAAAASAPTVRFGSEESWTAFAAWAGDELGVRVTATREGFQVGPDEHPAPAEDLTESGVRRSWLRRRRQPEPEQEPEPTVTVASPRAAIDDLLARFGARETPPFVRPVEQPEAVHDLTERLFAAYRLDGGKAHVAGFHLVDRAFVRLSTVVDQESGPPVVRHAFFDHRGEPIDAALVGELSLDRVSTGVKPWPRPSAGALAAAVDAAREAAKAEAPGAFATIVWAKHASGRLRFEFGDESIDTIFDGWARTLQAPPVVCPETGRETRHLATTTDGRIAAAEEIAASTMTKARFLRSELETCSATGGLIEAQFLSRCDATDKPVRSDKTVNCPRCGQRVAPAALTAGGCVGCEGGRRVGADDPRLAAVLDKHPRLGDRRWTLAETPHSYVLLSSGWLRRRCVTIDKDSMAVVREAEAPRFSPTWRVVD